MTHAKRLLITIFAGDDWHDRPLYEALIDMLRHKGLVGATVTRASAGFPGHGQSWAEYQVDLAAPETVRIEVVDRAELIDRVLGDVQHMVERGLVEVQDTTLLRPWPSEAAVQVSASAPLVKTTGIARELHVQISEGDRWEGEPLATAIVKRAQRLGIAGVSVFRGVLGYGARGTIHRHRALALHHDDPMMLVVVDTPDRIEQLTLAIEGMISDACLLSMHDVQIVRFVHQEDAGG